MTSASDPLPDDFLRDLLQVLAGPVVDVPEPLDDEEAILAQVSALHGGRAADDPEVRRVLAEVAAAWSEAASESANQEASLSPHVRAAALVALDPAPEAPVPAVSDGAGSRRVAPPLRATPLRTVPRRRGASAWWIRAAALVLVGLAVHRIATRAPGDASELHLVGFDRVRLAQGRPEVGSGRSLAVGQRIASAAGERVALRLLGEGAVLLAEESAVSVVERAGSARGAHLRLDAGEVRARSALRPVTLDLGSAGSLVLLEGDACARRVGAEALGDVEVRVFPHSRVVFEARDGPATSLEGPARVALGEGGLVVGGEGGGHVEGGVDLCDTLAFFGPSETRHATGRFVAAPRWRVVTGAGTRRGRRLLLRPATLDDGRRQASVAWRPAEHVKNAAALRAVVEAPPGVRVSAPPASAPEGTTTVAFARSALLSFAADWHDSLDGAELVLTFTWPEAPGPVDALVFQGVRFERPTPAEVP